MPVDEDVYVIDEDDEGRKRGWLPWVSFGTVVAVVIYLILTYGNFRAPAPDTGKDFVKSESVKVPDLVGMDAGAAETLLAQLGLTSKRGISYDVVGPPGSVGYQEPDPGVQVRPGSLVYIGVIDVEGVSREAEYEEPDYQGEAKGMTSREPKHILVYPVPNVVGMSEREAASVLAGYGFEVRPMYQPRNENIGKVIQQAPAPDSQVAAGYQVHILIAVDAQP